MEKMGFETFTKKGMVAQEEVDKILKEARREIARKGGLARAAKMTAKDREDIARKGGLAGGRGRK